MVLGSFGIPLGFLFLVDKARIDVFRNDRFELEAVEIGLYKSRYVAGERWSVRGWCGGADLLSLTTCWG